MATYSGINIVGGQSRPLSAFMQDRQQEHDARVRDQTQQMQLQDAYQQHADRAALRDIVKRSGGDWNKAATDAAAAGVDPQSLMTLQDRAHTLKERGWADDEHARKELLAVIEDGKKSDELMTQITDQESLDSNRPVLEKIAKRYNKPFHVPTLYDDSAKAYFDNKRKVSRELHASYRMLTDKEEIERGLDPTGSYAVGKDGLPKMINKARSEQKSVEQWNPMTSQEAQAAGFPAGSVIYRSNRGKPLAAYTPSKGGAGGGGPARAQLSQFLVTNKIAPDMRTAWQMSGEAAMNPRKFAIEMTKMERGSMASAADPKELEARITYWTGVATKMSQEEGGGGVYHHPKVGDITDADLQATAQKYGMTVEQVKQQLGIQ